MDESVLVVPDIHESGVEGRHNFLDFSQIDVSDTDALRRGILLLVDFHQAMVLKQGDCHLRRAYIDNQILLHLKKNNLKQSRALP